MVSGGFSSTFGGCGSGVEAGSGGSVGVGTGVWGGANSGTSSAFFVALRDFFFGSAFLFLGAVWGMLFPPRFKKLLNSFRSSLSSLATQFL